MKRIFIVSLAICSLWFCKDEKKDYIEKVAPILNRLEEIGLEMEKTVEAIKSDGISILEFEAKMTDIEKRLTTEKGNFSQYMAPIELDQFQKNILEAIAGEQLAISSIKSYATRKNMYSLAEKQLLEIQREERELMARKSDDSTKTRLSKISMEKANLQKQRQNLQNEMDAQIKFYLNSHEYFIRMLKAMKKGISGRSK